MKMKKSLILLAVAAIICVIVYVDYARKPTDVTGDRSITGRVMDIQAFDDVSSKTVARIEVTPPGKQEAVVLEKDGGEWKVKSGDRLYRLAKYKADQLFGTLPGEEKKTELEGPLTLQFQARNPENHAEFDLTEEKATRVKFYDSDGKMLSDVLIGKSGTDWQTSFVRFPGKDEVYLAPIRLSDNFSGADVGAWRDKRLFPDLKIEDVVAIRVDDRASTRTYALAKRPDEESGAVTWWVTEPFEAKARQSTADSMARTLVNLNAAQFVTGDEADTADFDPPTLIARFDVKDEPTEVELVVGAESSGSKGQYYAKTNRSDDVVLVYKPYGLSVAPDTLKETPTPTPSPSLTPPPTETPVVEEAAEKGTSPTLSIPEAEPAPSPAPTPVGESDE